jgi:hypothetical protein
VSNRSFLVTQRKPIFVEPETVEMHPVLISLSYFFGLYIFGLLVTNNVLATALTLTAGFAFLSQLVFDIQAPFVFCNCMTILRVLRPWYYRLTSFVRFLRDPGFF